jgi:signal transduction histidine kinase
MLGVVSLVITIIQASCLHGHNPPWALRMFQSHRQGRPRLLLALLTLAVVLALGLGCRRDLRPPLRARNGVLDLAGCDLGGRPLRLTGPWAFYWERFLDPQVFQDGAGPAPDGYLAVPRAWKGLSVGGRRLGGTGYATLRLRLLPGPAHPPLALKLTGVASACRLWVDGQLRVDSGRLAPNGDQEVLAFALQQVPIQLADRPVELVLQVSNFHRRDGKLPDLILGREDALAAGQIRQWGLALFVIGTLFVMGIYHLALFLFRRSNPAPLFFGLYCLLWLGNLLCVRTSGWAILLFWPALSGNFLYKTYEFCYFMAMPMSFQFFRVIYPQEFPRWVAKGFWILAGGYALLTLFGSTLAVSNGLPWYHLASGLKLLITVGALGLASRRGRSGAWIVLVGMLVLGVTSLNDMLNELLVIETPLLMPIGMLAFLLAQALVLAMRFSRLFGRVELLSGRLGRQNQVLQAEISARVRLEREVLSVSEAERRRISQELHDGLCQELTGARLQCVALQGGPGGDPGLARLGVLLERSLDRAYDLAHGLWPVEHTPEQALAALAELTQRVAEASGCLVDFQLERGCTTCSHPGIPALGRIAQEALGNAVKHARATRILVRLDCGSRDVACLTVQDNGQGRQPGATRGGLGLRMMAHRARSVGGSFHLEDRPDGGVRVTCSLPCRARG